MHAKTILFYMLFAILALAAAYGGHSLYQQSNSDFSTLDGATHRHSDYLGKYVVVNYFAEWCAPCLKEVPELVKFNQTKPDNAVLFAISYDNLTDEKLIEIKAKYKMDFPLINHIDVAFPFERPEYLPATYIVSPEGKLQGKLFGEQSAENLIAVLQEVQ